MINAVGYAAKNAHDKLSRFEFEREAPGAGDVQIQVLYCGVCHSDIHQVKNEWHNTVYPCLPGHEVVGRVTSIGASVTKFKQGDVVGVGCMIDSCGACEPCQHGEENYCEGPNGFLATYNGPFVPAKTAPGGGNIYGRDNTFGGYSNVLVVSEDFVLAIPEGLAPEAAAPILCAGVTTHSPMKHWGVKAGDHAGVIGLGGLGHMAVKIAKAMGAEVTVFTTSKDKAAEAQKLGAAHVLLETDAEGLEALASSFDFILSTVPETHDLNPFITLLKRDRTLTVVGALAPLKPVNNMQVVKSRRSVSGSLIGSIAETREVLEFCADHGIAPEIQLINIDEINDAYKKVEKGEVRFRYVIDMASLAA